MTKVIHLLEKEYLKKLKKERDIYIFRSINRAMYVQKVRKPILSPVDGNRRYINETESILWN